MLGDMVRQAHWKGDIWSKISDRWGSEPYEYLGGNNNVMLYLALSTINVPGKYALMLFWIPPCTMDWHISLWLHRHQGTHSLEQVSPTTSDPCSVRYQATQQRWAAGKQVKLHLYLQPLPILPLPPELTSSFQTSRGVRFSPEHKPDCELLM